MKILLTGATGFIGHRLRQDLLASGHELVCVSRSSPQPEHSRSTWLKLDFAKAQEPEHWRRHLAGVDVVVNTVGIFREAGAQSFEALHHRAPVALFSACAAAGVRRVVQLSALGADAQASSAYHLSKRAADEHLLALPLEATVAQPSLVFGAGGTSARLFLTLATMPLLALPAGGRQPLQPIHVDDVVSALHALVETRDSRWSGRRVALVGPRPLTLADYLQALRQALQLPRARMLAVPAPFVALAARLGDAWRGSLLDTASWRMLQRGNVADAATTSQLLARSPREAKDFVPADRASAWRMQAQLAWLLPVMRLSLAFVWIFTGIVSLGLYPVEHSYELLRRTGVPAAWQPLLLYGAAVLDLLLGVLTLALGRRHRPALWAAQALLIVGYTVIITFRLPEFWLHPYGPLSKNLPMLAMLLMLWTLERRANEPWPT